MGVKVVHHRVAEENKYVNSPPRKAWRPCDRPPCLSLGGRAEVITVPLNKQQEIVVKNWEKEEKSSDTFMDKLGDKLTSGARGVARSRTVLGTIRQLAPPVIEASSSSAAIAASNQPITMGPRSASPFIGSPGGAFSPVKKPEQTSTPRLSPSSQSPMLTSAPPAAILEHPAELVTSTPVVIEQPAVAEPEVTTSAPAALLEPIKIDTTPSSVDMSGSYVMVEPSPTHKAAEPSAPVEPIEEGLELVVSEKMEEARVLLSNLVGSTITPDCPDFHKGNPPKYKPSGHYPWGGARH